MYFVKFFKQFASDTGEREGERDIDHNSQENYSGTLVN